MIIELWMVLIVIVAIASAYQFIRYGRHKQKASVYDIWCIFMLTIIACCAGLAILYISIEWVVHVLAPFLTPYLRYQIYP